MIVKKQLFSTCFILCFLTQSVTTLAIGNTSYTYDQSLDTVEPMWDNTSSVEVNLSFDGSKAICGAAVIGKPSTTNITGTVVLSRKNNNGTYTSVKTWSGLEAIGNMLIFNEIYYVSTGYTYRLTITSTVYNNSIGETVTAYYDIK